MTTKRVRIPAIQCVCRFCGHHWTALGDKPPRACAGCKRINWDKAPRPYKRKRP